MNILCVEDDVRIAKLLTDALEEERHHVLTVGDGRQAQEYIASGRFEMAILDLMIPEPDGFEVLRHVRSRRVNTPVLVLSARNKMQDVVKALDLGADDYMTKPFHLEVLFARVRSLSRRNPFAETPVLQVGALCVDSSHHHATLQGDVLPLTRRELLLLECLVRQAGRNVTRQRLIEAAWGLQESGSQSSLDFHMHGLRGKLTAHPAAPAIHTVRAIGYRLET